MWLCARKRRGLTKTRLAGLVGERFVELQPQDAAFGCRLANLGDRQRLVKVENGVPATLLEAFYSGKGERVKKGEPVVLRPLGLPGEEFLQWGWRVPFLLSIVLIVVGYFVRRAVDESPVFQEIAEAKQQSKVPVVELFGCVVTDVTDRKAARREIAILNRDARFAKFRLAGDSIVVELQLPAWPFVPEHLRAMVAMLTEMIATHEVILRMSVFCCIATLPAAACTSELSISS